MVGVVTSDRMTKTIVVRIERLMSHPKYHRVIHSAKKFKVHDERQEAHTGDEVLIAETRPISKDKRWRLVEILKHGEQAKNREQERNAELESLGVQQRKAARVEECLS